MGNLFCGGLGYLYVGRPRLAFVLLSFPYVSAALIGWSRLVLIPAAYYAFCFLYLAAAIFFPVHAAVIAVRNKNASGKKYNRWWIYVLWTTAWLTFSVLYLSYRAQLFGFEPFRVPNQSNLPTIEPDDFFMADTWRYKNHQPQLGEFVVYNIGSHTKYVKRLIGLPGDSIELRNGTLLRNGNIVAEPYLHAHDERRAYGRDMPPVKLGIDEYFVMGDFRDNSEDSRAMGPVRRNQLHGRAEYIWYSNSGGTIHWDRFGKSLLPEKTNQRKL
ncbi:MAG: signal peptidase I [Steroidobacter sp.]